MKQTDHKIDRLRTSWVAADAAAARWLAGVADEHRTVGVTTLRADRFAYLVLDRPAIAAPGTDDVVLSTPSTVWAIPIAALGEAARRVPAITDVWAHSLSTEESVNSRPPAPQRAAVPRIEV